MPRRTGKVVDGKIPLPDLRIEYESRDGERTKVDLELATDDYKPAQIAEKDRAGFRIYIDEGEIATPAFETWLCQYHRLFAALRRFRVILSSLKMGKVMLD